MRTVLALAASVFLSSAAFGEDAPKAAPKPTLTATQEIFVVYEIMCVKPGGKLEKAKPAIAKLEASNTVKAVPDAEAAKLFSKGSKVWATKTSAATKLFVTYDPIGICGVHVERADDKAMKKEFVTYVGNVQKGMKGSLIKKADNKTQGDSLFSYYIVAKPGAKLGAGFGLSTSAAAAKKSPQHLLTFNIAKPE